MNGYYHSRPSNSHEPPEAWHAFATPIRRAHGYRYREGLWGLCVDWTQDDLDYAERVFNKYRETAVRKGFDRAVMKLPGFPIWAPKALEYADQVILVVRDTQANTASIADKWKQVDAAGVAQRGQDELHRLAEQNGWPTWDFGSHATVSQLEEIVGHPLPSKFFDPDQVRN